MLISLSHKFSLWGSVLVLSILGILTILACSWWGIKTGLSLGGFAFLIFGGIEAVWYLATRQMQQRIDENVNEQQIAKSYAESENNPTIR